RGRERPRGRACDVRVRRRVDGEAPPSLKWHLESGPDWPSRKSTGGWRIAGVYVPAHFAPDDADVQELLARHRAADLITVGPEGLEATRSGEHTSELQS